MVRLFPLNRTRSTSTHPRLPFTPPVLSHSWPPRLALSPLLARSTIVITQRSALLLACVLAAVVSADRAGIMTCLMNKLRRLSPEAKSDVGCGSNSTDKNLKLELMKNQSKDNFTTAAPGSTCQERGLQEDVDGQCCQAVHMDFKGHCCMVGTLDKVRG